MPADEGLKDFYTERLDPHRLKEKVIGILSRAWKLKNKSHEEKLSQRIRVEMVEFSDFTLHGGMRLEDIPTHCIQVIIDAQTLREMGIADPVAELRTSVGDSRVLQIETDQTIAIIKLHPAILDDAKVPGSPAAQEVAAALKKARQDLLDGRARLDMN